MFSEVGQRNHVFSPSFILAKRARSYYCWKFHFWNYNGYSDLSAVEETVGKGRGGMGKRKYTWKEYMEL